MKTNETMQSNLFAVGDQDFEVEVLNSSLPVIVDFWGEWCRHCHNLAPVYQQLSQEYQGKLRFAKLEIDENPGVVLRYGVQAAPTLLIVKNGEEIGRVVGPHPSRIKRFIDQTLAD